ncbi:MAG: hypothetical protein HYW48_02855 [Deltaproteobacteria bacterium]|nr:hypothetical protein [Deltaproteobacteria bacterium]
MLKLLKVIFALVLASACTPDKKSEPAASQASAPAEAAQVATPAVEGSVEVKAELAPAVEAVQGTEEATEAEPASASASPESK